MATRARAGARSGASGRLRRRSRPRPKPRGLLERLAEGPVICAEGYLFEFERRGYLQAGAYVPEIVLERPDLVESLHREFVHAGSDVVEAFTYYAHRAKLRMIGREGDLAKINRTALRIARKVARSTGTLLAGDICNTSIYDPQDAKAQKQARRIFDEQIEWAVEAGVDFIVAETYAFGARGAPRPRGDPAGRQALPSSRSPSRATAPRGRAGAPPMPAVGSRRAAPTWSGSTAPGAPPRCCRCSARFAPPSPVTWPRCRCRTGRARPSRSSRASVTRPVRTIARSPPPSIRFSCSRYEIAEFARGSAGARRPLSRRLLRRGAASHPEPRRGPGPPAAREPVLAGHVQAHPVRIRQAPLAEESRVRPADVRPGRLDVPVAAPDGAAERARRWSSSAVVSPGSAPDGGWPDPASTCSCSRRASWAGKPPAAMAAAPPTSTVPSVSRSSASGRRWTSCSAIPPSTSPTGSASP